MTKYLIKNTTKALALLSLLSFGLAGAASTTMVSSAPVSNETAIHAKKIEGEETPIPPNVRAMIAKTTPWDVAPGLIAKLENLHSDDNAILVFCSTTHSLHNDRYENMIRLLHEEMVTVHAEEGKANGRYPNFLEYARLPNKLPVFMSCLERDALQSSPETLFRLFQIEEGALRSPPNTLVWLIKAAEGGHSLAQYVLGRKIWDWSHNPTATPATLQPYVSVDSYHRLMRSAAENGHRLAQMYLARFYLDRFPLHPENVEHINVAEGLRWLNIVAEQTEDLDKRYKAISWIGALYFVGSVGPHPVYPNLPGRRMPNEYTPNNTMEIAVDHAEALRWYMRIPEKKRDYGVISALRDLYRLGLGVPVDLEKGEHYQNIYTTHCLKV